MIWSVIYISLLLLPTIFLYSKNHNNHIFLLSFTSIFLVFALGKNSRKLLWLFPFILFTPIFLFYILFYGSNVNEQIIGIVLETYWQEVIAFLGNFLFVYTVFIILWIFLSFFIAYKNYKNPLIWHHRSRYWVITASLSLLFVVVGANLVLGVRTKDYIIDSTPKFLYEKQNNLLYTFKPTYPLGFFIVLYDFFQEQQKVNQAFAKHKSFKFNAKSSAAHDKQLIVLVLGESSRRTNWQLNGYSKPTNPKLSKQLNLVNFSNMLSLSNATRSSIPMMITRKPDVQVYQYDFPEKSLISAFKEAGFTTYWVSTQQKFGAHDTSTSVYAKEADHIIFLNKTNYYNQGETDGVVLPVFNQILNSSTQKTLVVIHTLGSHFDYSHRYPPYFDKFKPSLNDVSSYSLQDKRYKAQLINSYDNSILYTDYVLDGLINAMKTKPQIDSFLLYSSDHGEDLFDGQCDKSGHGNETIYNFEIASLAWYSNSFARHHRDKVQALLQNQHQKINQTATFPTLIDAASIDIPNDPLTRSLLKAQSSYPRLVLGSVDFDKHSPKGICKEMQ